MLTQIEDSEIEGLLSLAEKRMKNNIEIEKEKKRVIEEKQREREEKNKIKASVKQKKVIVNINDNGRSTCSNTKRSGRGIIQLNDDGTIIQEYETIASAVRETGVNSKSIRDAAKGIQKHAGGFCWRYKDEILKSK